MMKKLLLVLFVAGFFGLAFAYAPARVPSDYTPSELSFMEDTTKTKKDCDKKKPCCKKKCKGDKKKEKKKQS